MSTTKNKKRVTKPASNDPFKEAKGHPDGPSFEEMVYGQEEKNTKQNRYQKRKVIGP